MTTLQKGMAALAVAGGAYWYFVLRKPKAKKPLTPKERVGAATAGASASVGGLDVDGGGVPSRPIQTAPAPSGTGTLFTSVVSKTAAVTSGALKLATSSDCGCGCGGTGGCA